MTPLELLQRIIRHLEKYRGSFALCGALAASFYRSRPRMTSDVDIGLCVGGLEESQKVAESVIKKIGLQSSVGRIPMHKKRLKRSTALVIGHEKNKQHGTTVDFLLPAFPWLEQAISRAQANLLSFGFGDLPVILPEDVIIAKSFALDIEPDRFQDLDDLKSILSTQKNLDLQYLLSELETHSLVLPKEIVKYAPAALKRHSKR